MRQEKVISAQTGAPWHEKTWLPQRMKKVICDLALEVGPSHALGFRWASADGERTGSASDGTSRPRASIDDHVGSREKCVEISKKSRRIPADARAKREPPYHEVHRIINRVKSRDRTRG